MQFHVNLIESYENPSESEKRELRENCTFIKNNVWIFEGDYDFLACRFRVLSDGVVGSLGGLSQNELVEICKATFLFDESLLD